MKTTSIRLILTIAIFILILISACEVMGYSISSGGDGEDSSVAEGVQKTLDASKPTNTVEVVVQPSNTTAPTKTQEPTKTNTLEPSPTDKPEECGDVDLNGRYVDYRTWGGILYGWIMDAEQDGCDFEGTEYWFVKTAGEGTMTFYGKLEGTIEGDKVRVCYTEADNAYGVGYCLNLVIFEDGFELANGIEGWQYEKLPD